MGYVRLIRYCVVVKGPEPAAARAHTDVCTNTVATHTYAWALTRIVLCVAATGGARHGPHVAISTWQCTTICNMIHTVHHDFPLAYAWYTT